MKKTVLTIVFLHLVLNCFANGAREEKKRIEQRLLSHPSVESVCVWQHDARGSDLVWNIDIYLKNNGYMFVSSNRKHCTEENLSTGCFEIDRIGDYEFWFNYGGYGCDGYSRTQLSLASILQIQLNCIEDYINNYDKILQTAEELSKETIVERTKRAYQECTAPEFLNYYGNCLLGDHWCQVFARPLSETSSWWTDIK